MGKKKAGRKTGVFYHELASPQTHKVRAKKRTQQSL